MLKRIIGNKFPNYAGRVIDYVVPYPLKDCVTQLESLVRASRSERMYRKRTRIFSQPELLVFIRPIDEDTYKFRIFDVSERGRKPTQSILNGTLRPIDESHTQIHLNTRQPLVDLMIIGIIVFIFWISIIKNLSVITLVPVILIFEAIIIFITALGINKATVLVLQVLPQDFE